MAQIPLYRRDGTLAAFTLVDDEDFPLICQWRWSLSGRYVERRGPRPERRKIYLHRELLGLMHGDRREVDHRNGNTLDNRRANLRVVTHAENCQNHHRRSPRSFTSEHRGVSWDKTRGQWQAQTTIHGQYHFLGRFDHEQDAAAAVIAARADVDAAVRAAA